MKNHLDKVANGGSPDSTARFVTDFTSLISAIDGLMLNVGNSMEAGRDAVKPNGNPQPRTLTGMISALRNHAEMFVKSVNRVEKPAASSNGKMAGASLYELAAGLNRAQTLKSVGNVVGNYCYKTLRSPAGMVFVHHNGDLQMISQWQTKRVPQALPERITANGPIARAFRTGKPVFGHKHNHTRIGRYFFGLLREGHGKSVTFLPISHPSQQPVGVIALVLPQADQYVRAIYEELPRLGEIVSACIERARSYDEVLAAKARAENTIQSKDEFLSILSHELKNPMLPILGWSVALSSGTLSPDKQNIALDGIVRNIKALNYLIEDLFDANRIASGKFRLELAEVRIQDVAREALSAVQHNVETKKLRISTDISEAIPPFMADPRRLHQVMINLLNNAVKFTPGGGSIAMRVRKRNHSVECIISDSGKGIERKFLPFVFERFRQEQRSSKISATGLGLGLAIVREIVELHGGSIQASSNGIDKGATFIVRLPLRRMHKRNGRLIAVQNNGRASPEQTPADLRTYSDTRRQR